MPRPAGHKLNAKAWDDVLVFTGLSLTQVAERADVPRASISSLLGGFHGASVPVAHRIAAAVGCNPVTLFPTLGPKFVAAPEPVAA